MSILTILIGGLSVAAATAQAGPASTPPRLISGSISNADYPAAAIRAGAQGTVRYRLTVGVDGRVTGCAVTGSSGNSALDSTTCALAQRRFRYRPATRNGSPVVGTANSMARWVTPRD